MIVVFDKDCCLVKDKNTRTVLLQGTLMEGLWKLEVSLGNCNSFQCCLTSSGQVVSTPCTLACSVSKCIGSDVNNSEVSISSASRVVSQSQVLQICGIEG